MYTRLGGVQGQANVSLGLGHVYLFQSKYEEVEGCFMRAQELWARCGSPIDQANALRGLGYLHRKKVHRIDARVFFERASKIHPQTVHCGSEGDA